MELTTDNMGRRIQENYSLILTDTSFEKRLNMFDPNLKLMFDQTTKKWMILCWNEQNYKWDIILTAEDQLGNPIPCGDWMFGYLQEFRRKAEEMKRQGADQFLDNMMKRQKAVKEHNLLKHRQEARDRTKEDFTQYKKLALALLNEPVSDATAGYRKVK